MSGEGTHTQPNASDPHRLDEILAELMRAVDAGQSIEPDEWLTRYPDFAADLKEYFEKQERVERLVRPLRQATAQVLHVRCPHCHHPIELLEDARLAEVSCPSCGSSFSLVGEKTISHYSPGEKTIGHFQLLDRVGIGAFGSVWKARDTQLDRTVAVKIPRNTQLDEPQTELFLRDARAAAQLKHPNIVGVHEVGKQDGTIYIVSDFIQGAPLKEWMTAKRLTPRETAELCVKIAKALHHAHEAGVIHRDLKPGNIMMDTDGEPHIVDFGLAKREVGEITMTVAGQILGTPAYMSPEQARGEGHTVDRRADIYSLGVVLFELLLGELPFRGDKQMLIVQILKDDPPGPRKLNSSVPRDLETICLKCLEKETTKRYSNALDLAHDLERFLYGEPIHARPVTRTERAWRWCRRKPALAGLFGAMAAFLLAIVALTTVGYFRELAIRRRAEQDYQDLQTEQLRNSTLQQSVTELEARRSQLDELVKAREQKLYRTLIKLARKEWMAERMIEAEQHLNECPPEFRDEEWSDLRRLCSPTFTSFDGKRCVAISLDGRLLAAGSDHAVRVWDVSTNRLLHDLSGHTANVATVAFSPGGELLASGSMDGSILVWNPTSGKLEHTLRRHSMRIADICFSNDGRWMASASTKKDSEVILWDAKTFEEKRSFNGSDDVALSPDGRFLGTIHGSARVWELDTVSDTPCLTVGDVTPSTIAFAPDGKRIAVSRRENGLPTSNAIEIWNLETKQVERRISTDCDVETVAFSSNGRQLASLVWGTKYADRYAQFVVLWDLELRTKSRVWHVEEGDLAFNSLTRLATVSRQEVRLWDVTSWHDPTRAMLTDIAELRVGRYDWPQWGGSRFRNNTPSGVNIPDDWYVGDFNRETGQWIRDNAKNIKWVTRLGSQTYGNPVVANGRIFVGTNNGAGYLERYPSKKDLGVLLCFEEKTGKFLWQHSNEKLPTGRVHDWPLQGVCSTPVVAGNRLWYTTNRGEIVCLDTEGFYDDENDGAFQDETVVAPNEADVIWRFDMMNRLGVSQHNMANCSMISVDGMLFACTSNGVDESHIKIPAPDAPSFIALDRDAGKVLWTDNSPGVNILHAQWASPSYGVFDGQPQVIFPGGDGWVYSFDPQGDGNGGSKLLWKFDANPKSSKWVRGGRGTRNSIIAFPAIYDGLIYIAVGRDPGDGEGLGHLWCIDPTNRLDGVDVSDQLAVDLDGNRIPHRRHQAVDPSKGERAIRNPNSAVKWHYSQMDRNRNGDLEFEESFHRCLGIPTIKDDILYTADYAGLFHCLNAKTGEVYWSHDLLACCWGSPLLVDGKVYIGDEDGTVTVFRHSIDRTILNVTEMGNSVYMTPIVANNVLYIASKTHLFAIAADGQAEP